MGKIVLVFIVWVVGLITLNNLNGIYVRAEQESVIQYKLPEDQIPNTVYVDLDSITSIENNIESIEHKPNVEKEKQDIVQKLNLFIKDRNKVEKELFKNYRDAYNKYLSNTKELNNLIIQLYTYNRESELLKEFRQRLSDNDHELFSDSAAAEKIQPIIEKVHKKTKEDIKKLEQDIRELKAQRPKLRQHYAKRIVEYKEGIEERHRYLKNAAKVLSSFIEQYKEYLPAFSDRKTSETDLENRQEENSRCASANQQCQREIRLFSKDLLTGKATLAKREKKLSVDCPASYTEKEKDEDCPMGQKLVRSFKKYKWKYCPYHSCQPIKCPQNWLDLESAECPVGKIRKPVKRSYYNGRKKCDYFVCKEDTSASEIKSHRKCVSWGDPHYVTFDNHRYNFYGRGDYLLALSKGHNLRVDTRTIKCNAPHYRPSCNKKVGIQLNEKMIIRVTAEGNHCDVKIKETGRTVDYGHKVRVPGGGYFKLWRNRGRGYFKAVAKDGARAWGFCRDYEPVYMNLYVDSPNNVGFTHGLCVRRSDHKIEVKGLLDDEDAKGHFKVKGHDTPWKSKARKRKAYHLCSQLTSQTAQKDCIFDIKESNGSPEQIFRDYKDFLINVVHDMEEDEKKVKSCKEILDSGLGKKSGLYDLYLDGDDQPPTKVYCDMETRGGGWTLVSAVTNQPRGKGKWEIGHRDDRESSWENSKVFGKTPDFSNQPLTKDAEDYKSKAYLNVDGSQLMVTMNGDARNQFLFHTDDNCLNNSPLVRIFQKSHWSCGTREPLQRCSETCRIQDQEPTGKDRVLTRGRSNRYVFFKAGERNGVQDINQDLAFISLGPRTRKHIHYPVGLGSSCYGRRCGRGTEGTANMGTRHDGTNPPNQPVSYFLWVR